jgi:hypothetical protein
MFDSFATMDKEFKEKHTIKIVAYEDIVLHPQKVISDIVSRLGVTFNYDEINKLSKPYTSYGRLKDRRGVYQDSLTMWKTQLSQIEVILIHNTFKKFMNDHKFHSKNFEKLLLPYLGEGNQYLMEKGCKL